MPSRVKEYFILDVQKDQNSKTNIYNVLQVEHNSNAKYTTEFNWKFQIARLTENQLIRNLACYLRGKGEVKFGNFKVSYVPYKVIQEPASFARFDKLSDNSCGVVILSKIVKEDESTMGYKVASISNGQSFRVTNVTEKELLAYCKRFMVKKEKQESISNKKLNSAPIQNAMVKINKEQNKFFISAYPGEQFIKEYYKVNTNKYSEAHKAKADNKIDKKKDNLDALKKIYTDDQIKELMIGSKQGLKIKLYANPKLSAQQMKVLRSGLEKGLDISYIAFPEYEHTCMRSYILDMENGINIKQYLNPKYSYEQLSELSLAADLGLDISKMGNPSLSASEMSEIRERLMLNIFKDYNVTIK